jgi:hypothetical protein
VRDLVEHVLRRHLEDALALLVEEQGLHELVPGRVVFAGDVEHEVDRLHAVWLCHERVLSPGTVENPQRANAEPLDRCPGLL